MNELGLLIKKYRLSKNYTQKDIYKSFCSRKELSRIENGHVQPSIQLLKHICNILDLHIDVLILESQFGTENFNNFLELERCIKNHNLQSMRKILNSTSKSIDYDKLNDISYYFICYYQAIYYLMKGNFENASDLFEIIENELAKKNIHKSSSYLFTVLVQLFKGNISEIKDEEYYYINKSTQIKINMLYIIYYVENHKLSRANLFLNKIYVVIQSGLTDIIIIHLYYFLKSIINISEQSKNDYIRFSEFSKTFLDIELIDHLNELKKDRKYFDLIFIIFLFH